MRRSILAVPVMAVLLPAQDPPTDVLAAARPRLEKALQKTAGLRDTAFTAEWGPDQKPKDDNPFAMLLGRAAGKAHGTWHERLQHVAFDGDDGDELLLAGRRALARSSTRDWALRSNRFADGNTIAYLPDVELLLQQLASWDLAVVHRETGAIDDRPVEIVTVTLNQDQVAEAAWSGALPPLLTAGAMGGIRLALAAGGGRQAATAPDATVDVAIALDPATSLVHRLHLRAYAKGENIMGGNVVIQRVGGGVQVARPGEADDDEDEEEAAPGSPLEFVDGLPKRSRKKKTVNDFTIRLTRHGEARAPALTDAQKTLLRL